MEEEEYLSAEDLRNRLYHSLRDRGLVNSMKSQLRTSLVTELKQSMKGKLTVAELSVPESGSLLHRAANSLVADHLRSCHYDYTYSVFLPECGIDKTKTVATQDLLQLLKISPQSRLFKKMTMDQPEKVRKGFLWQLLSELSAIHAQSSQSISTQTDHIKVATVSTLDEKMSVLDELFSSRREEQYRTGSTALEGRLLSFQKQLEERFKTELKLEVARVRDDESSRIRMDEKEKARKEFEQLRRELERQYQMKFDALVQRERNATECIQREQELQERETFNQRQSILQEIEAVHQREAQVKRETEVVSREKKLEAERLKALEQDYNRRVQELKVKETQFDQRLDNEMTKFKVEYQAKFMERAQNIEVREAKLRENERRVAEDQSKIDSLKDEVRDKTARVNELETQLHEAKHKEVGATRHNEFLNAKLRDMSDYASMKEQNITYRNELEALKTRMAEIMQLNERERIRQEEMLQELKRPTTISGYPDRGPRRDDYHSALMDPPRHEDRRYNPDTDRNYALMRQFEEQTLQMREMNQEMADLKQTLSHTKQALTNEVYRKPHGDNSRLVSFNMSGRSAGHGAHSDDEETSLKSSRRKKTKDRLLVDVKDVYNDVDIDENDVSAPRISTDFTEDESSNQSAEIIAETKYRLKNLEKEAKNLEKAYVDFHYNMTNPSALPEIGRGSLRQSRSTHSDKAEGSGHRGKSPTASPISRPMSSTPYRKGQSASREDSSDSLHELKGSSSHGKDRAPSQEPVPRFSLSDMSDDEDQHRGPDERVERPRPITVEDLEARPGSPSIMVVKGDTGSEDNLNRDRVPSSHGDDTSEEKPREPTLPSRLPPLSLDDAWKTGVSNLDDAWKPQKDIGKPAVEEEEEAEEDDWEARRRQKEEERRRKEQEAWEREQRELEQLQANRGQEESADDESVTKDDPAGKAAEPDIDPVMQQYMAMVQQQKQQQQEEPSKKTTIHRSEQTASQDDDDVSLTDEVKSDNGDGSADDFDW